MRKDMATDKKGMNDEMKTTGLDIFTNILDEAFEGTKVTIKVSSNMKICVHDKQKQDAKVNSMESLIMVIEFDYISHTQKSNEAIIPEYFDGQWHSLMVIGYNNAFKAQMDEFSKLYKDITGIKANVFL